MSKRLRLILGDQLNIQHSWFEQSDENTTYLMIESRSETDYARHHIQKVVAFFSAMREFAAILEKRGHRIIYLQLDDQANKGSLDSNIISIVEKEGFDQLELMEPDEYRVDQVFKKLQGELPIDVSICDSEHFLTSRTYLENFFEGKKMWLMESFYRSMRKKYQIMMDGDKPLTGRWNYDAENRKKIPKDWEIPDPLIFNRDVSGIVSMLENEGVETIGNIESDQFIWPVTRDEALDLFDFFLKNCFQYFGVYQDSIDSRSWSVYHSRISFALNSKLISPLEIVNRAVEYWEGHEEIDIAQVEGFVRQIIGWREYMRGIYWAKMPEYAELNFFGHDRKLPKYFWTGKTKMNCVKQAVDQSLDHAYAHHIQRLMVTGNFMLLAGVHPDEADAWYLGIYIDALEWVEITNTRGMSQFADGGIVGTKPYVSSASYINKMGNLCSGCHYNLKTKLDEDSCPFNTLYWRFYNLQRDKLEKNPRIGMMYRTWDKMNGKEEILSKAEELLANIEEL